MDGSIVLGAGQRKRLLEIYRGKEASPANVRLRAHIVLLLAEGQPWALIAAVLFCSTATIARWKSRFDAGGIDALLEEKRGQRAVFVLWMSMLVTWVTTRVPRDFGYCRSRWCYATLALILWKEHQVKLSVETVRRYLHKEQLVWRRPRPVLDKLDPQRPYKLRKIRELLRDLIY